MSAIPARKSFAQVAAEANIPIITKENPMQKPNEDAPETTGTKLSNAALARLSNAPEHIATSTNVGRPSTSTPLSSTSEVEQLNNALQAVNLEDGRLQSLPIDQLSRKEFDTKSVASRTTHTLDEKESLRPDDSASMQAAPEEDAFSPAGSIVAGSKEGSDPEVRAFRHQLDVLESARPTKLLAPRPLAGNEVLGDSDGPMSFSTPPIASPFAPSDASSFERPKATTANPFIPPDEKLLEALASPKDRLFVLKIEQDMIDFLKDSKDEYLQLPQMNAFYRMLSHKLADYYFLGHLIDESMSSVRIFRTPHCRLPPPLIGPNSIADGGTPPVSMPARKIMRRGGEGAQNDLRLMSRASSKGADGDDKDKGALTREERENRYKEARARIFKDFKEDAPESAEAAAKISEKDASRSSSASGAKKTKKNKKHKDDEFEPRSAFTGLTPFTPPPATQIAPDGTFYNPFAPYAMGAQQVGMGSLFETNQQNQMSMPPQYAQQQYQPQATNWQTQQGSQGYMMPNGMPGYGPGYYDQGMTYNGVGSPQAMASQLTPRATAPTLSMHQAGMAQGDENVGWKQNYANQLPAHNGAQVPSFADYNQQMAYLMMQGGNGFSPQDQHGMSQQTAFQFPGHGRPQFNPQSQAFVPGTWGPSQGHQGYTNMSFPQQSAVPHYPIQAPPPPQGVSGVPQYFTPPQNNQTRAVQHQHQHQHQPRSSSAANGSRPSPNTTSSISKWGTPATLPAKPPPPAILSPFVDLPRDPQNQQPLPPNPYANGMRPASNNTPRVGASR